MSDADNTTGVQSTMAEVNPQPHTDAAINSSTLPPIREGKTLPGATTATDGPAAECTAGPSKDTPEKRPHQKCGLTPTTRVLEMMQNKMQHMMQNWVQKKETNQMQKCLQKLVQNKMQK